MVRTQIQLAEEQADKLRRVAAARRRSVADLIRESVARLLAEEPAETRADRMRHAARVFGRFRSGHTDLASSHDEHFADAVVRR